MRLEDEERAPRSRQGATHSDERGEEHRRAGVDDRDGPSRPNCTSRHLKCEKTSYTSGPETELPHGHVVVQRSRKDGEPKALVDAEVPPHISDGDGIWSAHLYRRERHVKAGPGVRFTRPHPGDRFDSSFRDVARCKEQESTTGAISRVARVARRLRPSVISQH